MLSAQITRQDLPKPSGMARLSIIMPAFNEQDSISAAIEEIQSRFRDETIDYEVIIVDDGSTDETRQIAEKFQDGSRVKVVGYQENQGKGHAVRYGAEFARGEFLVFLDSDLEISSAKIHELIDSLKDADFCIASKRHPMSHVKSPADRVFLSRSFNLLARVLTGVRISDTQSGFKAMRTVSFKRVSRLLSVKKYAFDVELLTVANLLGMKIVERPVEVDLTSSQFRYTDAMRMLIDLLGIAYRLRLLGWYQKNSGRQPAPYRPRLTW
jgi:glycosyltransferase involved in cell wall biosynthesis